MSAVKINTSHSPYWAKEIRQKANELDMSVSALFRLLFKEVYKNDNKYGLTPDRLKQLKDVAKKRKRSEKDCVKAALDIWLDKVAYLPHFV